MSKVLFLHGKEGTPTGSKPTKLRDVGFEVVAPTLDKNDWRGSINEAELAMAMNMAGVIVGSSRGGAVAASIPYLQIAKKILIAPAWKAFGVDDPVVDRSTVILHCKNDNIVPFEHSEELAERYGCQLIECGIDHRMNDPETLNLIAKLVAAHA